MLFRRSLKKRTLNALQKATISLLIFTFLFSQIGVPFAIAIAMEGTDRTADEGLFMVQTLTESPLPIYEQADESSKTVGAMSSSDIYNVMMVSGDGTWYRVVHGSEEGWVQGKYVEVLGDESDARASEVESRKSKVESGEGTGTADEAEYTDEAMQQVEGEMDSTSMIDAVGIGVENLPLYPEPEDGSDVKAAILAGVEFTIYEVSDDGAWYKTYYYEHSGWVRAADVTIVDGDIRVESQSLTSDVTRAENYESEVKSQKSNVESPEERNVREVENVVDVEGIENDEASTRPLLSDVSEEAVQQGEGDTTSDLAFEGLSGEIVEIEDFQGIAIEITDRDVTGKVDGQEVSQQEAMVTVVEATTPLRDTPDETRQEIITSLEGKDFGDIFSISIVDDNDEATVLQEDDLSFVAGSVILIVEPTIEIDPGTYTIVVAVTNPVTGEVEEIRQNFKWGVLAMNTDKDVYGVGDIATVDFSILDEAGAPVCLYEDTENENNLSFRVTGPDGTTREFNTLLQSIATSDTCGDLTNDVEADYATQLGFDQVGIYTLELDALTSNGRYSDVVFTTLTQAVQVTAADDLGATVTRNMNTRLFPNEDADVEISVTFADDYEGEIYDVVPKVFEISDISDDGETDDVDGGSEFQAVKWDIDVEAGDTETFTYTYNAPDVSPAFYTVGPFQSEDGSILEGRTWQIASDALPAPGGVDTDLNLWLKADAGVSKEVASAENASATDLFTGMDIQQTFTAGFTEVVHKVSIGFATFNGGEFNLNIRDGGTIGAGAILSTQNIGVPIGDSTFILDTPVALTAGNQYTIELEFLGGSSFVGYRTTGDDYSGGEMYISATASGQDLNFTVIANPSPASDGDTVNTWLDQGINGLNATTVAGTPTYQSNLANAINFNPTVDFDGSSYLATPSTDLASFFTFFTVESIDETSTNVLDHGIDFLKQSSHFAQGSTSLLGYPTTTDSSIATMRGLNLNGGTATRYIQDGKRLPSSRNFTSDGSVPYGIGALGSTSIHGAAGDNPMNGRIAEVVVYNSNISTAGEQERIQAYLALKYGLTYYQGDGAVDYEASDGTVMWDATAAGDYNSDIAGIGRDDGSALSQVVSGSINDDALVKFALDDDFASLNSDSSRSAHATDLSFMTWGNNRETGDTLALTTIGAPTNRAMLTRAWKVSESGSVGTVFFTVPADNSTATVKLPSAVEGVMYLLTKTTDDNFSSGATETALTLVGDQWQLPAGIDLADKEYFTFATGIPVAPGGVLPDLSLWLKADSGTDTTVDGDPVNTWTDAFDGTVANAELGAPLYALNQFNGNPGLNFGGISDFNVPKDGTMDGQDSFSLFSVQKHNPGEGGAILGSYTTTAVGAYRIELNDTVYGRIDYGPNNALIGTIPIDDGAPHITLIERIRVGTWKSVVDGVDEPGANNAGGASRLPEFNIGSNGGDLVYGGHIAEVITYREALNETQEQQVNSYLSLKYGITLDAGTVDYLASDTSIKMWDATVGSSYNNDIFGIGRDDGSSLSQVQSKSVNSDAVVTILAEAEGTNAVSAYDDLDNREFLTVGNDDGGGSVVEWSTTGAPAGYTKLAREWSVQENNGDTGSMQLDIDVANTEFDVPALVSGPTYLFLYDLDNDGDLSDECFTGGTCDTPGGLVSMADQGGDVWRVTGINFTSGQEFTIASENGYTVSGVVYYDESGEGTKDAGETARLQDVTVTLYNDVDTNGKFSPGDTVYGTPQSSTATNGEYEYTEVLPGTYVIKVDQADTALNGLAANGSRTYGVTSLAEIALTLSAHALDQDFGFDEVEVAFAGATSAYAEAASSESIGVTQSLATAFETTIPYLIGAASTASTADYTDTSANTLSIAAGSTSGNILLDILADVIVEGDENIIYTLGVPTNAANAATNQGHTATITDDDVEATLTAVSIASDNADPTLATTGDIVTVSFTSDVAMQNVAVEIAGQTAAVSGGPTDWTATYVTQSTDAETVVPFTIDGESFTGTPLTQVIGVTDATSVTVDTTPPADPTVTSVDGDTTDPYLTNDKTPDVILTVDNGTTVSSPGWSCTPDPVVDNTATCTPDADLTEGTTPVTFTSTDPAGNPSDTGSVDIEVDVTDPTNPAIVSVGGDTTDPYLTGSTQPPVILTVDNGTTVTAPGWTCSPDPVVGSAATCTPDTDLAEGNNDVTFTSIEPSGNVSDSGIIAIEVDTSLPIAPTITSVDSDTTPPYLTGKKQPEVILTSDNATSVSAPGWTCTPDPVTNEIASCIPDADLDEGDNDVTFTAEDPVGNQIPAGPFTIEVDTFPPTTPAITSVDGDTTDPYLTNDATPDVILIVDNDTTVSSPGWSCTPDPVTGGTATCTPDADLTEGNNDVTFTSTEPSGNTSDFGPVSIEVDTIDPTTPAVVSVEGDTSDPYLTNEAQPPVILTVDDATSVTAPGWSCTPDPVTGGTATCTPDADLTEGNNDVTFTSTEPSGNTSDFGPVGIEVDTIDPTTPAVVSVEGDTLDPYLTNEAQPPVILTVDDATSVTAPGWSCAPDPVTGGTATCTPDTDLPDGNTDVTFTSTEPSGNTSAFGPVGIEVDTQSPTDPIIDSVDGDTTDPYVTAKVLPPVAITAENGTSVTSLGWTCTPDPVTGGGVVCTPGAPLAEGNTDVNYLSTDPAGNSSNVVPVSIEVDTTPPDAPEVVSVDGNTAEPYLTSEKLPPVIITADNETSVTAPNWSCTPDPVTGGTATCLPSAALPDGNTDVTFTSTDLVGNATSSIPVSIEVDTVPPPAPVAPDLKAYSDSGPSDEDDYTNLTTLDLGIPCSVAGHTIDIFSVDSGSSVLVDRHTCFSATTETYTLPILSHGTHMFVLQETDLIGNVSEEGAALTIIVDTEVPLGGSEDVTGPLGPINNVDTDIVGSCGAEFAHGTVRVTTKAPNGFTNTYDTDVILDLKGDFTLASPGWQEGSYEMLLDCSDQAGNGPVSSGPFGPVIIDSVPPTGPGSFGGPLTPTRDLNEDIIGSCGTDAPNGSVKITTTPQNGFNNSYNTDITLDADGAYVLSDPDWNEGAYELSYACKDASGNGPTAMGPFGPVYIDTTPPVGPGKVTPSGTTTNDANTAITGACGPDSGNGKVTVTTLPANGFRTNYGVEMTLDVLGNFSIPTPFWNEGTYQTVLACTDWAGNGPAELGPFGSFALDVTSPDAAGIVMTSPLLFPSKTSSLDEPIIGTCGPESANGTVKITTEPANGFASHLYGSTIALNENGNFLLGDLEWVKGFYSVIVKCHDSNGNGPTTKNFGSYGVGQDPTRDLHRPKDVEAACLPNGDVHLTWHDDAKGENHQVIQRREGDSPWQKVKKTGRGKESWTDDDAPQSAEYRIRVEAGDEVTEWSKKVSCSVVDVPAVSAASTTVVATPVATTVGTTAENGIIETVVEEVSFNEELDEVALDGTGGPEEEIYDEEQEVSEAVPVQEDSSDENTSWPIALWILGLIVLTLIAFVSRSWTVSGALMILGLSAWWIGDGHHEQWWIPALTLGGITLATMPELLMKDVESQTDLTSTDEKIRKSLAKEYSKKKPAKKMTTKKRVKNI